ncbi:SCO1860 family LAETG-anchored protein [Kitasatospora paracochleata]|uniref:LPXTG-motif cell wall-anchored protein n=1 Tax=Kitasatospora paracochleata TaxID=58354 RepID=A0ABT1ISJ9_9ACTN|nr:SCO1860 family LAETG-anchored protein [Kitasatospora paracochleata]MCP2308082.1 LPXTG-motif cell wall-anchored protein [Kitasatospora paracochleata]
MSAVLRSVVAASLAAGALAVTLPMSVARAADAARPGKASAVTAELDLDVSLLNKAVDVPVNVALNKVQSPAQQNGAMLTAKVDGVDQNRPVTLVKAQVGQSVTKADDSGASASVKLVDADVHAPGLPLTTLVGLEALSAEVSCPVDGQPTAKVVAPAKVTVLGKSVTVGLNGPSHVEVPGVGSVDVEFSRRTVTSTTAAASALQVKLVVNPLNLNVAKVEGTVTVASVSCEKPVPASVPSSSAPAAAPTSAAARPVPAQASESLASTGANGTVPLVAGGVTLLVAGGAALWMTRRRRATHARRH